jgi:D-3-phosphoglycerate dehydrogenase
MVRPTKCVLLQIWGSEYDKFNIGDAKAPIIPVANNHGSNAPSVAEHTILMMLGVARPITEMHERHKSENWEGNNHGTSSHSLSGEMLVIVGLGKIGVLGARRGDAFGVTISSHPAINGSPEDRWSNVSFGRLPDSSDFITFHVRLSESSRGMIDMKHIGWLKCQPLLINTSREELIDCDALTAVMQGNLVKGVAVDDHHDEPKDPEDLLFSFPGVLFSPRVAGSAVDS